MTDLKTINKGSNTVITTDEINIKLDWNATRDYDLDISAFILDDNGLFEGDDSLMYYNNTKSKDNSVLLDADQDLISINLRNISPDIKRIAFIAR